MYLLVAGLFQEVKHPIMNKTSPCPSLNDDFLVAGMFQEVKHATMNKTSLCLSLGDDSSGNTSNSC
ncbi:unnamed protein product [Prunus armeniaca]|uniref:Uncharacterized protein n=1 Tax=Prunus armeniaca TaxID=36596 RepID=A0A6J5XT73_PRUAR|nr:unnamed protein product [Prunus armeniaca]CAB4283561.1 unnamed protein product [Prunus armeniaca]CAB4283714.1 unnamed protein product [Prunus armeniaca]CAB4285152.1 unnamed protein product [Prunus armeniaca]CAB4314204.1 unnamed protein product [Prunus armeniaca]